MMRGLMGMAFGVAALALAVPAMAITVDVGDLSGKTYGNGESFKTAGGGTVDSSYSFTLSQSSVVHMQLTDTSKLTGLTASLYSVLPSGHLLDTLGPFNGTAQTDSWQSESALAAGTYRVDVVGSYATRGSYSLSLSSDVAAPVPGPAGFIVAGAGALVVLARRRRKAQLVAA